MNGFNVPRISQAKMVLFQLLIINKQLMMKMKVFLTPPMLVLVHFSSIQVKGHHKSL